MQSGHIFQTHGAWHLRYRVNGKQVSRKLADYSDQYRTLRSLRPLADSILQTVNEGRGAGPQTVQEFIETTYLPHAKLHKRPSTYKGYKNLFNAHVKKYVGGIRLFAFRTSDGQRTMNVIAAEHSLSHMTLMHIKSFLSGVFTFARRMDAYEGVNPMDGVEIPKGRPSEDTHAYSHEEVETMSKQLEGVENVGRVAVIVAAYTGLSLAELKGLRWEDINAHELKVVRTVWHGIEGLPKTKARKNSIPLLPIVADALDAHRKSSPDTKWVFEGPYLKPLDLATLGSKRIKAALKGSGVEWHGWHALRRGFATRLHEAGVQDRIIQALMRHSSLSVTMKHYVKATPEANIEAMRRLNPRKRR
jgi:integrase